MIYIVTSGEYSDYSIDAVFQNKDKAEAYCKCHPDAEIEEWEFFDDHIYTPFNVVTIHMNILSSKNEEIHFDFRTLSQEDASFYMVNRENVTVYTPHHISIFLIRMLPKNYDKQYIKNKYTKVFYDLISEIKYVVSDIGLNYDYMKNSYDQCKYAEGLLTEYLAGKFGIETESV